LINAKHGRAAGGGHRQKPILLISILAIVLVLVAAGVTAWRNKTMASAPWFASYVDATVTPAYDFESPTSNATRDVILSFIVADPANPCVAHWGTGYSLDEAATSLDLDARVASLEKHGGRAALSFGGAGSTELATSCTDLPSLEAAYLQVISRYEVSTVDFDIEGGNLSDASAGARRSQAIAEVQRKNANQGRPLDVWLTLPVSPQGLTDDGVAEVESMLKAGVDLAGVNIMTMNYGDSRLPGQSMLQASEDAAIAAHSQLGIIYQRAGQELDSQAVWAKIGLTPMIGVNEIPADVFSLQTAREFAAFASTKNVGRMSMWSVNRDTACTSDIGVVTASHTCSGLSQESGAFGEVLSEPFTGRFK